MNISETFFYIQNINFNYYLIFTDDQAEPSFSSETARVKMDNVAPDSSEMAGVIGKKIFILTYYLKIFVSIDL